MRPPDGTERRVKIVLGDLYRCRVTAWRLRVFLATARRRPVRPCPFGVIDTSMLPFIAFLGPYAAPGIVTYPDLSLPLPRGLVRL